MTAPYTDKDLKKWQTGLYAANPQQAQALVRELVRLQYANVTLHQEIRELKATAADEVSSVTHWKGLKK
jgi:uncharacterized protein YlxW (UPF0749 family)